MMTSAVQSTLASAQQQQLQQQQQQLQYTVQSLPSPQTMLANQVAARVSVLKLLTTQCMGFRKNLIYIKQKIFGRGPGEGYVLK